MLPKRNRLKKKKDIERVLKKGRGFKENLLFLKIINNNLKESRFAFMVSKKVSKKAVLRNKIKRQLRELVRLNLKNIKKGFDAVLMISPNFQKTDFNNLKNLLEKIFKKAQILSSIKKD
jgi:ribonuclease P protein component